MNDNDDNVVKIHSKRAQSLIGSIETYQSCVVEGKDIPGLRVKLLDNGMYSFCLDRRFSIDVPEEYAHQVAWLTANALAIGAGYSHLGADSKDKPFAPSVIVVGDQDD